MYTCAQRVGVAFVCARAAAGEQRCHPYEVDSGAGPIEDQVCFDHGLARLGLKPERGLLLDDPDLARDVPQNVREPGLEAVHPVSLVGVPPARDRRGAEPAEFVVRDGRVAIPSTYHNGCITGAGAGRSGNAGGGGGGKAVSQRKGGM